LERPDQPHGPNNHFIARYAFIAQPIGNGLDLNYLHNQTFNTTLGVSDGFFRNEGVGSWELNLAAFLADLNTNIWGFSVGSGFSAPLGSAIYYQYNEPANPNSGRAFDDARALLAWRYDNFYNSLISPPNYFYNGLVNAGVDGYTVGNLMTTTTPPLVATPFNTHWAGSDSTNQFFALASDLFDAGKTAVGISPANIAAGNYFTPRLQSLGSSNATYDRYTFYRMLDQIGTDSSADPGKMNLNYRNVTNGVIVAGMETNMYPWTPVEFFTNAADRLLKYYTKQWSTTTVLNTNAFADFTNTFGTVTTSAFGVTNIPVLINGQFVYTPAVNRLLQLAANLYDASTNTYFPSVFRPTFRRVTQNGFDNIYINGFEEVVSTAQVPNPLTAPILLSQVPAGVSAGNTAINVYGVPWIFGAKKGFPNFNQLYLRNFVQVTRKLQVTRSSASVGAIQSGTGTNQMFVMSITNRLGFSFWNSYNTNYVPVNGNVTVHFGALISMSMTNVLGANPSFVGGAYNNPAAYISFATNFVLSSWPGSAWTSSSSTPEYQTADPNSFMSGFWDFAFLPESQYKYAGYFTTPATEVFEKNQAGAQPPIFPQFGLATTNLVQAFILDGTRIIDYVQLANNTLRNVSEEVRDPLGTSPTLMWVTNGYNNASAPPTIGVVDQITVSRNNATGNMGNLWKKPKEMPGAFNTPALEARYFNAFFTGYNVIGSDGKSYPVTNTVLQAPYTPTRSAWDLTLYQANDPLVHYLATDLATYNRNTGPQKTDDLVNSKFGDSNPQLNSVLDRYQPWGLTKQLSQAPVIVDTNGSFNLRFRDPLVWRSDYWDFPTGKYPNVGWIGRVHRGTPWQTVYLKQRNVLEEVSGVNAGNQANVGTNTWAYWTGNVQQSLINGAHYWDAVNMAPVADSDLFDLFTTRFNDNAARGALSVNQTHLAAWSAVLSGAVALTNITDFPASDITPVVTNLIISPAGIAGLDNSAIGNIVTNLNTVRSTFINADGVVGTFEHTGDILRVPAFTEHSPFLNWNDSDQQRYGISDAAYEWLPQQLMGLLRVSATPRYVIYCYGQALRPAAGSQVLSGNYFQMVTNYQVVAESAARAVIRVDKQGTNYTTTVESYNPLPPD
jgi:hypothetical protein